VLYYPKLNGKDDDETQVYAGPIPREKMVGANLHDDGVEGPSELWLERVFLE
jgi:hypothetical protein